MGLTFREHVSVAETEYGVVLLDTRTGNYWQLNPTAAVAAKVLVEGGDQAGAAQRLVEEFEVDGEVAAADVTALVDALRAAGVVTG
ncbi:lasso peptide biosynthesis PqqD family chaperone [Crossiella sp. CA198]|uniref:lasso peptide biosynthesis PqqD family chaperone n=1 Tax=Crossiella sp. CA198 TaxID=3455607 RepID=UPI003F8D3AB6